MKTTSFLVALLTLTVGASALPATAKPATKAADNCAAAKKLADGIDANIKVQQQELKDVGAVKKAIQANDKAGFASTQKTLLATIDKGVSIRENNQKIAPPGNGAIDGLKVVEGAQKGEKSQAQGLKGTQDDLATISKLETEFNGGIKKNQENKTAALKGC